MRIKSRLNLVILDLKLLAQLLLSIFFTQNELQAGKVILEKLPYSHESYDWVNRAFHPSYKARWIPKQLPTLLICSEFDYLTPASLSIEAKQWQRENIQIELIKAPGIFRG